MQPPVTNNSDLTGDEKKQCTNVNVGEKCQLICKPGYNEVPDVVICTDLGNGRAEWRNPRNFQNYECQLENDLVIERRNEFVSLCVSAKKVVHYMVSQPEYKRVITYCTKFDIKREYPLWSMAYRDELNDVKIANRIDYWQKCPYKDLEFFQNKNYDGKYLDKGHLVPFNQIRFSRKAGLGTFWYTNFAPQFPKNNQGTWRSLETKIEKFGKGKKLLILTGVSSCVHDYYGENKCAVPSGFWKLICAINPKTGRETTQGYWIINDAHEKNYASVTQQDILKYFLTNVNPDELWNSNMVTLLKENRDRAFEPNSPNPSKCASSKSDSNDKSFWNSFGTDERDELL